MHDDAVFLTLTYAEIFLPDRDKWPGGNLHKEEIQKFFKLLRYYTKKTHKIRYFACGEYGEKSKRAHWHAIVFGMSMNDKEIFEQAWTKGYLYVGDVNPTTIEYVANYVTKKLPDDDDKSQTRYNGRNKEMMFSSRRPGLGDKMAENVAESLLQGNKREFLYDNVIRMGGRIFPLDNYMKSRIDYYMRKLDPTATFRLLDRPALTLDEQLDKREEAEIKSARIKRKAEQKEKI